jgi:hypothetical protein
MWLCIITFIVFTIISIYITVNYENKIITDNLIFDENQYIPRNYTNIPKIENYIFIKNIKDSIKKINIPRTSNKWSIEFTIILKITQKKPFCILKSDNLSLITYENNKIVFNFKNVSGSFKTKSSIPELSQKVDIPIKVKWIQYGINVFILINDEYYIISDEHQDFKQYLFKDDILLFDTNQGSFEYSNITIKYKDVKKPKNIPEDNINGILYQKKSELIIY